MCGGNKACLCCFQRRDNYTGGEKGRRLNQDQLDMGVGS
jgi:hypothetical protein